MTSGATRERLIFLPARPVLYAAALFVLGLAYRATFLSQGFNGTDEGWLQTLGLRVANGQVPYRDFYFVLPPVSLYREAALIKIFGDGYGILVSRWAFAVEATLASVLAFVILRRFVGDHLAFLSSVPTIFFSVIFYYFSNYTYDAVFFTLLAITFLIYLDRGPAPLSTAAGVAAALAFLAKPTFLIFLILLPAGGLIRWRVAERGVGRPWWRAGLDWRFFLAGYLALCALIIGYLALVGALGQFFYQAFILTRQAFPTSLSFLVLQDMPDLFLAWPAAPTLLVLGALLLVRGNRFIDLVRLPLLGLLLAYLVVRMVAAPSSGPPTGRQALVIVVALGVLLALNAAALVLSVRRPGLLPTELVFYALALEYVTQINYSGLRYSYMGTYLSLPVALIFVRRWLAPASRGIDRIAALMPIGAAALLAGWFVVGGFAVTRGTVYRDADRARLTASFRNSKLAGITSLPSNVARVDGLVSAIDARTARGDPILVFPDLSALYFLTDRRNPTKIDWYDPSEIIPSMTQQAVSQLDRDPARVVLLQTHDEADFMRAGPPLDYAASSKWAPLYTYVISHYTHVADVGDVQLYVPQHSP